MLCHNLSLLTYLCEHEIRSHETEIVTLEFHSQHVPERITEKFNVFQALVVPALMAKRRLRYLRATLELGNVGILQVHWSVLLSVVGLRTPV